MHGRRLRVHYRDFIENLEATPQAIHDYYMFNRPKTKMCPHIDNKMICPRVDPANPDDTSSCPYAHFKEELVEEIKKSGQEQLPMRPGAVVPGKKGDKNSGKGNQKGNNQKHGKGNMKGNNMNPYLALYLGKGKGKKNSLPEGHIDRVGQFLKDPTDYRI